MFISNCICHSPITQINMRLAEESIVKTQKYIYEATKTYAIKDIYKYQRVLLSTEELLLITTHKIVDIIKKKYVYPDCIIKNF